ncbi:hypothetical protein F0562_033864 [Nyssa sinensis]|uniref:Uncharacterized protein n=1 Tax=Nyssa sinensis TaxID=561372 RepID=A0A5J5AIR0_9ASTE|nr:hypothetical protein F0562_033864 [Nyssa sinensis]
MELGAVVMEMEVMAGDDGDGGTDRRCDGGGDVRSVMAGPDWLWRYGRWSCGGYGCAVEMWVRGGYGLGGYGYGIDSGDETGDDGGGMKVWLGFCGGDGDDGTVDLMVLWLDGAVGDGVGGVAGVEDGGTGVVGDGDGAVVMEVMRLGVRLGLWVTLAMEVLGLCWAVGGDGAVAAIGCDGWWLVKSATAMERWLSGDGDGGAVMVRRRWWLW